MTAPDGFLISGLPESGPGSTSVAREALAFHQLIKPLLPLLLPGKHKYHSAGYGSSYGHFGYQVAPLILPFGRVSFLGKDIGCFTFLKIIDDALHNVYPVCHYKWEPVHVAVLAMLKREPPDHAAQPAGWRGRTKNGGYIRPLNRVEHFYVDGLLRWPLPAVTLLLFVGAAFDGVSGIIFRIGVYTPTIYMRKVFC